VAAAVGCEAVRRPALGCRDWPREGSPAYCRYVIAVAGLAWACVLIVGALVWTARLVHIGNLDALALAEKVATPEPVSALDWPELRLAALVPQPDEPLLVLVLVEWPAHRQRAATLLIRLDRGDQRSVPLLSQWCAARASVSPTVGGGRVELRRRQSLDRVRGVLLAEDPAAPWLRGGLDGR